MGSQRGSASATESQIQRAIKAFGPKQTGEKRASKSKGSGGGGGSGYSGKSKGSGGTGGGGGGGSSGGTMTAPCRHKVCKCRVAAPAKYRQAYCEEAAASGTAGPCRCN